MRVCYRFEKTVKNGAFKRKSEGKVEEESPEKVVKKKREEIKR